MIADVEAELRAAWSRRGEPAPRHVHCLKFGVADYANPGTAFVFFVFRDQSAHPSAVAKVARDAVGDPAVRREVESVRTERAQVGAALAALIPEPLADGEMNGRAFGAWTALGGTLDLHHVAGARGARGAETRIAAALAFLRDVQRATPAAPVSALEWIGSWDSVRAELAAAGSTAEVLETLAAVAATVWHTAWPAALAHGDFFPGNILFDAGRVSGVVDWATVLPRAPIWLDPLGYELSFALHALLVGRGAETYERRATAGLRPFAAYGAGLAAAGVDVGWGSAARLLTVVAGAVREMRAGVARRGVAALWLRLLELEARDCAAGRRPE